MDTLAHIFDKFEHELQYLNIYLTLEYFIQQLQYSINRLTTKNAWNCYFVCPNVS